MKIKHARKLAKLTNSEFRVFHRLDMRLYQLSRSDPEEATRLDNFMLLLMELNFWR